MPSINRFFAIAFLAVAGTGIVAAQSEVTGIPVTNQLVVTKCGGCHQRDANGIMRRISYIRTSPEVWEQAIKRMVRLNGVVLKPEEARAILKYLSTNQGLAPEEAKASFWEAEHRMFRDQSDQIPDNALHHTCNYCHTIGRVLTQRRTKEDYVKLAGMHLGLFPGAENVLRPRRQGGPEIAAPIRIVGTGNPAVETSGTVVPNAPRGDGRYPMDVAIDYLAKAQPLMTPEWAAWKSVMKTPKLDGKWMLTGYQIGKGRVFGTLTIETGAAPDEVTTKLDLEFAATGRTFSRTGKAIVYTGYSWRGRSTAPATNDVSGDPNLSPTEWREAMMVSRDGNAIDGRFFWGGYQEFGMDAHLTRIGAQPMLAGASVFALQSPSTSEVKLYGANIPADLKPADVDFGTGVTVKRIVRRTANMATVEVEVASNQPSGIRDVAMSHSVAERAVAIYDKVSYIKVQPDANMARLGGGVAAKQFAQFEAIGYANGADGKPETMDDVPVGPLAAKWGMEEFLSTPDDDDVKFVGSLNENTGMFTPAIEGPNPERKKQSNNYATNNWGDVWVSATFAGPDGAMKARSYLVVTIPTYVRWDQPEVGQ